MSFFPSFVFLRLRFTNIFSAFKHVVKSKRVSFIKKKCMTEKERERERKEAREEGRKKGMKYQ